MTHEDWSASSDADLVSACREGDGRAWRELVHRYRRLVYGVPRVMGLQPADADEVFQNTFAELLRWLPRLRDPSRLEPWLVTASRRAALRLVRDQRRRSRLLDQRAAEDGPAAAAAADAALERLREGERVTRALEAVGEPCRSLLLGLFSEVAASYRTLARQLGLAVGSLGSLRARCLRRLRLRLQRQRAEIPPGSRPQLQEESAP